MNRRHFLALSLGLASGAIASLSGCGGGGGSKTSGATVAPSERLAILDQATSKLASLNVVDPETACQQMADFLKSLPEIEAAGVSKDRCAWGRFTDGRLLIVVNNRKVTDGRATRPRTPPTRAAVYLPEGESVRIIDNLGTAFEHVSDSLAEMLPRHGYGLVGDKVLKAGIDDLKQVKGDGIFYIESHGGLGSLRTGKDTYGIYSGTLCTAAAEATYAADLDAGHLSYMVAEVDEDPVTAQRSIEPRYGIMPSFVEKYMSFGPASVVYVSACTSDNAEFKAACLRAGAGLYIGWTAPTLSFVAYSAASFLFDRLLGENRVAPTDKIDAYTLLFAGVQPSLAKTINPTTKTFFDTSPDNGSKLTFTASIDSSYPQGIVPSIVSSTYDSDSATLTLDGYFGSEEGAVERDPAGAAAGQTIPHSTWSEKKITLSVPDGARTMRVRVGSRAGNIKTVGGTFTISGPGGGTFRVRDAISVYVNERLVYADPAGATEGERNPVSFYAPMLNSKLRLTLRTAGTYGGTGEIYLKVPAESIYASPDGSLQRIRPKVLDLTTNNGQIDLGVVALL